MKIKISEATNLQIDGAVASTELKGTKWFYNEFDRSINTDLGEVYSPSTDWAQGGPIIEREMIETLYDTEDDPNIFWYARPVGAVAYQEGPTPLIAAMRCYVASKFGDTIDIPEEFK